MPTWRDNPLVQNERAWEQFNRRERVLAPPSKPRPRRRILPPSSSRVRSRVGVGILFVCGVLGVFLAVFFAEELPRLGDSLASVLGEIWTELRGWVAASRS